ncbi:MAG: putative peptidoglycan glycosyltransferase FtsW [Chloroflexota bacterium]
MARVSSNQMPWARPRRGIMDYFSFQIGPMDYPLLITTMALIAVGLMMVYSASLYFGMQVNDGNVTHYFSRQLQAVAGGIVAVVALLCVDYHLIRRGSTAVMLITIGFLFFVLVAGEAILGATRGLSQGSYQPGEFAKLVTVIYIADWLSSKGERIRDFGMGFLPFLILVGIVGALVAAQPDLSTAIIIGLTALTLFVVAGARFTHFSLIVGIGILAVFVLINLFPHANERWNDFWLMIKDPAEVEWHTQQVYFAFARGGLFGRGLGNSFQKTGPLPVPHTDSILAVIGEELGFIGCIVVFGLLLYIVFRGFKIALETDDQYGRLMAFGITCWLAYQAILNGAVMTGIIPFTGQPLPFVSYGGSSMVTSLTAIGVLLSISHKNKRLAAGIARTTKRRKSAKRRRSLVNRRREMNAVASVGRRNRRSHHTSSFRNR